MATFQDHMLGDQIIQNLGRMVPNMRDNAAYYKTNPKAKSAVDLATEINGDMVEFLRRITWMEDLATRNLQAMTDALTARSLTINQANTLKNTLKNAALALQAASKTTQAEINTAADTFLAAIPAFERIF